MAQQTIDLGTAGTNSGDTVREAFDKCNDNFNDTYKKGDGGFFESTSRIKVHPGEFQPNKDSSTYNVGIHNNGGSARPLSTVLEPMAFVYIPEGYKATKYKIFCNQNRVCNIYANDIDDGSASSKGAGICNFEVNMSDVTSNTTNYLTLKVDTTSTLDYIYGAYVTITKA